MPTANPRKFLLWLINLAALAGGSYLIAQILLGLTPWRWYCAMDDRGWEVPHLFPCGDFMEVWFVFSTYFALFLLSANLIAWMTLRMLRGQGAVGGIVRLGLINLAIFAAGNFLVTQFSFPGLFSSRCKGDGTFAGWKLPTLCDDELHAWLKFSGYWLVILLLANGVGWVISKLPSAARPVEKLQAEDGGK